MPETNSHEGISHPFGAKHGTATKNKGNLGDRMYPNFLDELAKGSASFAGELGASRRAAALEAVKSDIRDLSLTHNEKYHADWQPYRPDPDAAIPYCSIGARPINLGISVPVLDLGKNRHTEHQQIVCSDGENFGLSRFGDKNNVLIEEKKELHAYIMSPIKYRKDIIVEARKLVDEEWEKIGKGDRYSYTNNNCQHYIEKILNKAIIIAKERRIKLVLD